MFGKSELKMNKQRDGRHCDLCGCSFPAVRCDKCSSQIFCLSCDDMYHRHPKRRFHLRKAVDPTPTPQARPVLPMKVSTLTLAPGDPSKMPLPPPRKKKSGKSIFDSFRRGSPALDTSPNLSKKEYSWTGKFSNITKFINRPLPPVPDSTTENNENVPENSRVMQDHSLAFIHRKVDEKPPALPQRQPRTQSQFPMQESNENKNEKVMSPMTNGNSQNFPHMMGYGTDQNQNWAANQQLAMQVNAQQFGTIRRQSQPMDPSMRSMKDKPGGMQLSSSASDLTSIPDATTGPMMQPYPGYPYGPQVAPPYPYPMYPPQFPAYPQYFGNSWANLTSPPPSSTDPNFSDDQSESSPKRYNRGKHKSHMEKKAKRSQSVLMDRMNAYPGHFYPFGPYPPGYPANPWMPGHPGDAPPSPSVSLRSLSRLSHSHRRRKTTDEEEDFSSSPLSRPKSSSSEISKSRSHARDKSFPTSSSSEDEEVRRAHSKAKATPPSERKYLKQQKFRRKSSSPVVSSSNNVESDPKDNKSSDNRKLAQCTRGNDAESSDNGPVGATTEKMKKMVLKDAKGTPSSTVKKRPKDMSEESVSSWQCKHCTFINPANERICQVCCKTAGKSISPVDQKEATPPDQSHSIKDTSSPTKIETQQADDEEDDEDSQEKRDIAVLNSALDEAEKQINESLVQLMKVKQESSQAKEEKVKYSSESTKHGAIRQENKSSVPSTSNQGTTTTTNATDGNMASLHMQMPDQGKGVATTTSTETKPDSGLLKDSFCQTYQDIEQVKTQAASVPSSNTIMNEMTPNLRQEFLQPTVPLNAYQAMLQEQGYTNGYGGMQRAHSQASLFGSRLNAPISPPGGLDYGNMNIGYGPSPMARSLSRASLLGEADAWSSAFQPRPKPDFYLSMEELVERRRQDTMRAQGLELVRMIREAEQLGFTADDIQVALNSCGKQNPVIWLQENWKNIIKTVSTLATNYGKDKQDNDVGVVSESESREALRFHKGNIWAAVTECVEGRQRKFLELSARGNFTPKEIVDALTESEGDIEVAYAKLTNTSLKPFLMRIWGSGEGVPNLEGPTFSHIANARFHPGNTKNTTIKDSSESEEDASEEGYGDEIEWEEDNEDSEEVEDEEEDRDISPGLSSQEIASFKSDDFDKSEKYHTLTHDTVLSPESDKSDYCDAFGPGLGDRYLSSTSIDEIYLIEGSIEDGDIEFEPKRLTNQEGSKKKSGLLSKLAGFRRGKQLDEKKQAEDSSAIENKGTSEDNNVGTDLNSDAETASVADQNAEVVSDKNDSRNFNPLNILKNTFSALKDTVVGSSAKPEKKGAASMFDRRTIVVNDDVILNTSKTESESEELLISSEDEIENDLVELNSTGDNELHRTTEIIDAPSSSSEFKVPELNCLQTRQLGKALTDLTSIGDINKDDFSETEEIVSNCEQYLTASKDESCNGAIDISSNNLSEIRGELLEEIPSDDSNGLSKAFIESSHRIATQEDIDEVETSDTEAVNTEEQNDNFQTQSSKNSDDAELPFIDDKLDSVLDNVPSDYSSTKNEFSNNTDKGLVSDNFKEAKNVSPISNEVNRISSKEALAENLNTGTSSNSNITPSDGAKPNYASVTMKCEPQLKKNKNLSELAADKLSELDVKFQHSSTENKNTDYNGSNLIKITNSIARENGAVEYRQSEGAMAKVEKGDIYKTKSLKQESQTNKQDRIPTNLENLPQSIEHSSDLVEEVKTKPSDVAEETIHTRGDESPVTRKECSDVVKVSVAEQLSNTDQSVLIQQKNGSFQTSTESVKEELIYEYSQSNSNANVENESVKSKTEVSIVKLDTLESKPDLNEGRLLKKLSTGTAEENVVETCSEDVLSGTKDVLAQGERHNVESFSTIGIKESDPNQLKADGVIVTEAHHESSSGSQHVMGSKIVPDQTIPSPDAKEKETLIEDSLPIGIENIPEESSNNASPNNLVEKTAPTISSDNIDDSKDQITTHQTLNSLPNSGSVIQQSDNKVSSNDNADNRSNAVAVTKCSTASVRKECDSTSQASLSSNDSGKESAVVPITSDKSFGLSNVAIEANSIPPVDIETPSTSKTKQSSQDHVSSSSVFPQTSDGTARRNDATTATDTTTATLDAKLSNASKTIPKSNDSDSKSTVSPKTTYKTIQTNDAAIVKNISTDAVDTMISTASNTMMKGGDKSSVATPTPTESTTVKNEITASTISKSSAATTIVDTKLPSTSKTMQSSKSNDEESTIGLKTKTGESSQGIKIADAAVTKPVETKSVVPEKHKPSTLDNSKADSKGSDEETSVSESTVIDQDIPSASEFSAELTSSTASSTSTTSHDELGETELDVEASSPVRPVGHLRRMSFNTRKEAIFRERNRDSLELEQKPWFLEKKVDTYKPTFPKRSIKQQLEFERKVRKLVSDRKCRTYRKAEIVAQLMELKFEETESIYAANECSNLDQAISFLQQECQLCAGKYPVGEIVSMVHCSHKACKECIKAYFTIQIRDRTIMELQCPFCNEPDITDEDTAQDYFNHLDIMLKKLVDFEIHELFQRKLRDRVLMKDPNFRWCSQCSSGFIADPYLKRLICPDCNAITCATCRRLWEREHEGVSCEVFAEWKDAHDPEAQTAGLAKLLTEDGIDCPSCHFRYALAKGGCMHFKCIQCQHDFCSGCSRPFKMGKKCGVSEFCVKLGLHAHHPRNCLFYLRDKEPEDLQRLLDMNDVVYNKDLPPSPEPKIQCDVMEQKETSQGMVDDICGKDVQEGYAGLCRVHYVEYLGQLVNKYKIDPIQIFDNDDLELVLKRASIRLPPKRYRETNEEYRDKLVELIEEKLPLGQFEGS